MVLASGVRKRRVLYLVLGLSCIAVILGVITALSVRARAPRPVVSPEPSAAFTPTAPPGRAVSIAVSPQENVEPGELIVLTGSFCWFSMFFLLFLKMFPIIAISEVKELEIHAKEH